MSGDNRNLHVLTPSFPTRRSSDLVVSHRLGLPPGHLVRSERGFETGLEPAALAAQDLRLGERLTGGRVQHRRVELAPQAGAADGGAGQAEPSHGRSEEHTSELQSLMRISYAVFCLKKKKKK